MLKYMLLDPGYFSGFSALEIQSNDKVNILTTINLVNFTDHGEAPSKILVL